MGSDLRVVFVSSSISYSWYRKRLNYFARLGLPGTFIGFQRALGAPVPDIANKVVTLGAIANGNYLSRSIRFLAAIPVLARNLRHADLIYAFGLDMAFLALISSSFTGRKQQLLYEVHDIRNALLQKGMTGTVLRALERWLLKQTSLLIVTSPSYITRYYQGILHQEAVNHFVMENKLDAGKVAATNLRGEKRCGTRMTIGFFGMLRCQYAWEALKRVAAAGRGELEVYVRGVPAHIDSFSEDLRLLPNIRYGGPYLDPDDLSEIYGAVDIVMIAGFNDKISYPWSRTCRFYNACCFTRPMIAQAGTDDGKAVAQYEAGLCIDLLDLSSAVQSILSITSGQLERWKQNMQSIPESVYLYQQEHELLLQKMKEMVP